MYKASIEPARVCVTRGPTAAKPGLVGDTMEGTETETETGAVAAIGKPTLPFSLVIVLLFTWMENKAPLELMLIISETTRYEERKRNNAMRNTQKPNISEIRMLSVGLVPTHGVYDASAE